MPKTYIKGMQRPVLFDEQDRDLFAARLTVSRTRYGKLYPAQRDYGGARKRVVSRTILSRKLARSLRPDEAADHKNGNTFDNRRRNIRLATNTQNQQNSTVRSDNKSGFKGVCWEPRHNRWRATIRVNKRKVWLGEFDNKKTAALAYDAAAVAHFGEFAKTNRMLGLL